MIKDSGANPAKKNTDLNAAQIIRDVLDEFDNDKREQIIRWARESLGLPTTTPHAAIAPSPASAAVHATGAPSAATTPDGPRDIAMFVTEKNPQTDMQLATTIAYYYRFVAPANERKEEIDADSLREACRLVGKPGKLVQPSMTLNNAHGKGLLDRGSARGKFAINSVGENLVGMTLPGGTAQPARTRTRGPATAKAKAPKLRK